MRPHTKPLITVGIALLILLSESQAADVSGIGYIHLTAAEGATLNGYPLIPINVKRFIWDPDRGSVRFGAPDDATYWNQFWTQPYVGEFSFAGGLSTHSTSPYSIAYGRYTSTEGGLDNAAFGYAVHASGWGAFAAGVYADARSSGSVALGFQSKVWHSDYASALSGGFVDTSVNALALGKATVVSSPDSIALGLNSKVTGAKQAFSAIGANVTADYSFAAGLGIKATAESTVALGTFNSATNKQGLPAFGSGADTPLFEVGNGTSETRSNALTIYRDGTIRIHKPQGDISMGPFTAP